MDARFMIQEQVDILMLVYEAIGEVITRRDSEATDRDDRSDVALHLPHIIGEVLEESTFSIIDCVEITLLFEGKPAEMVDDDWKNPYVTNRATQGYYHFWPRFIEKEMGKESKITFTVKFENTLCKDADIEIDLKAQEKSDMGKSHVVPVVLLPLKEGVNPDTLYNG
jgi:hypothetical protein